MKLPQKFAIEKSLVYQEMREASSEISKHKWCRSTEEHRDIGFDQAVTEWSRRHYSEWYRHWLNNHNIDVT